MVRPKYPKEALKSRIGGIVELRAVVSPSGKTQDLTVVSGPPAFIHASLDAVRKWRFYPAAVKNVPVESVYKVKLNFNLLLQEAVPDVALASPLPDEPWVPDPSAVANTADGPVYRVSKDAGITQPKVIYQIDPEFSEEARKARHQGNVEIELIVGADGLPHDFHLLCTDWPSLNEKALEAVRQWKFQPGTKDGKPVQVEIAVEVEFHLYDQ